MAILHSDLFHGSEHHPSEFQVDKYNHSIVVMSLGVGGRKKKHGDNTRQRQWRARV